MSADTGSGLTSCEGGAYPRAAQAALTVTSAQRDEDLRCSFNLRGPSGRRRPSLNSSHRLSQSLPSEETGQNQTTESQRRSPLALMANVLLMSHKLRLGYLFWMLYDTYVKYGVVCKEKDKTDHKWTDRKTSKVLLEHRRR